MSSHPVRKPKINSGEKQSPPQLRIEEFTPSPQSEENRPLKFSERPLVSYALLLVNVGLFVAMLLVSQRQSRVWGGGAFTLTESLFGAMDSSLIHQGQWQRLVTPIFLHASWMHLIVNSLSLLWLGAQIETIYGGKRYFLVYLLAGITGNLASYLHGTPVSLGASGALFGLIGAGMIFPIRWRKLLQERERSGILRQMLTVAVLNLGIGFSVPHIDNFAHMGGLIGGAFAALFFLPEILDDRAPSRSREAILSVLVVLGVVFVGFCAFRQGMFAKGTPQPQVIQFTTYRPNPNSDWSIGVLQGWNRTGNSWKKEPGATLEIADSADPNGQPEAAQAVQFVRASKPTQQRVNSLSVLRAVAMKNGTTLDASLFVLSETRVVAVIFGYPTGKSAVLQQDIQLTLASFSAKVGSREQGTGGRNPDIQHPTP